MTHKSKTLMLAQLRNAKLACLQSKNLYDRHVLYAQIIKIEAEIGSQHAYIERLRAKLELFLNEVTRADLIRWA